MKIPFEYKNVHVTYIISFCVWLALFTPFCTHLPPQPLLCGVEAVTLNNPLPLHQLLQVRFTVGGRSESTRLEWGEGAHSFSASSYPAATFLPVAPCLPQHHFQPWQWQYLAVAMVGLSSQCSWPVEAVSYPPSGTPGHQSSSGLGRGPGGLSPASQRQWPEPDCTSHSRWASQLYQTPPRSFYSRLLASTIKEILIPGYIKFSLFKKKKQRTDLIPIF